MGRVLDPQRLGTDALQDPGVGPFGGLRSPERPVLPGCGGIDQAESGQVVQDVGCGLFRFGDEATTTS